MADDHTHVQDFFAPRAADWDGRFPDDGPAFAVGVGELGLSPGDAVLDAGCGTGRALPALRGAVGPGGTVVGADVTHAMLAGKHEFDIHTSITRTDNIKINI